MLSLQEISDRMEIQELIVRYAYAIDDRNWDALDQVFTPDAIIDYTEVGGARGKRDEIKQYLSEAMQRFPVYQHLSTTTEIRLSGDDAKARTILFNPMVVRVEGLDDQLFYVGLWYCDDLVRTSEGWRITHRHEKKSWNTAPKGEMP